MAPEQSHDPTGVGRQADVYGLGATLFWLLTGEPPYAFAPSVAAALRVVQQEPPRRLRQLRPEAPEALDDLMARMLDRDPARRPSPAAIMADLARFSEGEPAGGVCAPAAEPAGDGGRALLVDPDPRTRRLQRVVLESLGCECTEAGDAAAARAAVASLPFDVVLLDRDLPDARGHEVAGWVREAAGGRPLKVVMLSDSAGAEGLAESLARGADDFIAKPFGPAELAARVRHALAVKAAQERALRQAQRVAEANRQLHQSLDARDADVRLAHDALLFTMAKMAESRDGETPGHLRRLQYYASVLASHAAAQSPWTGLVDDRFLAELERCVPLHDIGKIGLPDDVLLKTTALDAAERLLIQTHPAIGDRILEALGREHGASLEFLGVARAIVRHHHERWDGSGYPDRLAGQDIPPAARLVALADVYDALRRRRRHKPPLAHDAAVDVLFDSPGQFDPTLLEALARCEGQWEHIYRDVAE
jgi:response regulator RpfG family c-di-GMP phosphodiesterase